MKVRAKKHLGQHFLHDDNIAGRVAGSLSSPPETTVLEIGPGTGNLTRHLLERYPGLYVIEIDKESVDYLKAHFPALHGHIIEEDFLKWDLRAFAGGETLAVTGNFPYHISTQILFKVWEHKDTVHEFSGMFQREVARRITAPHGSKTYGILSVLLQLWYDTEYLFEVAPGAFQPPPKVQSAVIRMTRKTNGIPSVDEAKLKTVVKTAFGLRRKTLKNSLKSLPIPAELTEDSIFALRAEQLSPTDFVRLTKMVERYI